MKVVLLTSYFPKPDNPVMGVWALREAQALQRQGAEVRVIAPTSWVPRLPFLPHKLARWAGVPASAVLEGIEVDYPRWALWQVGLLVKQAERDPRFQITLATRSIQQTVRGLLKEARPDVIYAHHISTCGWAGAQLAHELGIPLVVSEHSLYGPAICATEPGMREVFSQVIAQANQIIAVSTTMRQSFLATFPQGRFEVVVNGADPIPTRMLQAPRPEALRDRLVVFCAASLHAGKGVAELVEAFSPLARENRALLLRIAGNGAERTALQQLATQRRVSEQVEFLGAVPHQQVLAGLVWSDVFALLSHQEAFSVAYLEAMSAGLPIIWTTAVGNREFLKDGIHGFEVAPRDVPAARAALARLLGDAELRKRQGAASRELLLKSLTWDAHAIKLLRIFESAVREGPIDGTH